MISYPFSGVSLIDEESRGCQEPLRSHGPTLLNGDSLDRWQAKGNITSLKQHPLIADPGEVGLALFVGEAPTGWLGWENTASRLGLEEGEGKLMRLIDPWPGGWVFWYLLVVPEINQGLDFVTLPGKLMPWNVWIYHRVSNYYLITWGCWVLYP